MNSIKRNKNTKYDRIGEVRFNRYGTKMTVVEYNKHNDMTIEFDTGNRKKVLWCEFDKGAVFNPCDKSVYGIGYLGIGEYKFYLDGLSTPQYKSWASMFKRCYEIKYHQKQPTYKDCIVTEEWHNFQNFAKWYDENYYEVEGEKMQLDKDILIKGNKIYSPETCIFVPSKINYLFISSKSRRGSLPIGVTKHLDKFLMKCFVDGNEVKEYFDDPLKAFLKYKEVKEQAVKKVAYKYKDKIPLKLFNALLNYEVDILD